MNPINLPGFRLLPGMIVTGRAAQRSGIVATGGLRVHAIRKDGGIVVVPWDSAGSIHDTWDVPDGFLSASLTGNFDHPDKTYLLTETARIVAADSATGGCLAVLLGADVRRVHPSSISRAAEGTPWTDDLTYGFHATLGEACVAVAVALGRWPG